MLNPAASLLSLQRCACTSTCTPCLQCVSRSLEPLLEPFRALLTAVHQGLEPRLPQLLLAGLLLLLLALLLRSK